MVEEIIIRRVVMLEEVIRRAVLCEEILGTLFCLISSVLLFEDIIRRVMFSRIQ